MPDTAFDRWTRRRFGQAAGALIAAPVLAGAVLPADAKKHHKKKKKKCLTFEDGQCQGIGTPCNPYGSPCCDCIKCRQTEEEVPGDEFDPPGTILVYTCAP